MAKYFAFISYSHRDEVVARWLHRKLETYKPPKALVGRETEQGTVPAKIPPVFRDREELASSISLGATIRQALLDSERQIVICSPAAARSRWVNEEIKAYKKLGREDRIFCVVVDGEPNAEDAGLDPSLECFPEAVRYTMGSDGELTGERTEPIAADLRPGKDGKTAAFLKLVAGLLGVGYDTLRRRHQHRQQRRLALIATASAAGMVITTALATAALFARNEAETQRQRAEAEAETARQTTNFLIGLFEVSDPSEARGNSITAREILDKGSRRISEELADQPAVQAALMDTMGTVYKSLGLYGDARPLLEQALLQRRGLLGERHPDVGRSQGHLGEVLGLMAEFDEAEAMFREALAQQRAALADDDPEVAKLLYGLADVLTQKGLYADAEPLLREALEIQQSAFTEEHLATAKSLEMLGMSVLEQGRHDEARALLSRAVAMHRRLLGGELHPALSDCISNFGYALWVVGDYEGAEARWTEALEMNRALLGDSHPTVALNMNNLGLLLHDSGQYERAENTFQKVIDMQRRLLGEDHPEVAANLGNLALLYFDMGKPEDAFALGEQALGVYRDAHEDQDHPDIALMLTNLGAWSTNVGDIEGAENFLSQGLEMQTRLLGDSHPENAYVMTPLAQVYVETSRFEEARDLADDARRVFAETLAVDHWRTAWATAVYAMSIWKLGDEPGAESLLLEAHGILSSSSEARPSVVATVRDYLHRFYMAREDLDRAASFAPLT